MVSLGEERRWPLAVIAEVLGIGTEGLRRWQRRRIDPPETPSGEGRPSVIPSDARDRIRRCYRRHYGQWGPQVLAEWCRRTDLGNWSASTIAAVIADLREKPAPKVPPVSYEIVASGVMWSEDGTGFRDRGRKKELLVVQDEHARFKLGHRLTDGPAREEVVVEYLERAFAEHGAPLVLKHDGGSIFHGEGVRALLARHQVVDLTGPSRYPEYNGKQERSMRDIKSYERAMRRHGVHGSLRERIDAAIHDLNDERPRPVLGGCTAREVYEADHEPLPDRRTFIEAIDRTEAMLKAAARSRHELEGARRAAIEETLVRYGFMQEWGDVSRNYGAKRRTA